MTPLWRLRRSTSTKADFLRCGIRAAPLWSAPLFRELSRKSRVGAWRSLVAHLTGGQGVAGSNPVAPTIFSPQECEFIRTLRIVSGLCLFSFPEFMRGPADLSGQSVFFEFYAREDHVAAYGGAGLRRAASAPQRRNRFDCQRAASPAPLTSKAFTSDAGDGTCWRPFKHSKRRICNRKFVQAAS